MNVKVSHAAACGALGGVLLGWAMCIIRGVAWDDALMRVLVLAVSTGWMAMLLAYLNVMLTPEVQEVHDEESAS